jgi:hypothetical protein
LQLRELRNGAAEKILLRHPLKPQVLFLTAEYGLVAVARVQRLLDFAGQAEFFKFRRYPAADVPKAKAF